MWDSDHQQAFRLLQGALVADSLKAYPSKDSTFILDTDVSDIGIREVLSQVQADPMSGKEVERPIVFASETLTKTQKRFFVTRRGLLVVVVFSQDF